MPPGKGDRGQTSDVATQHVWRTHGRHTRRGPAGSPPPTPVPNADPGSSSTMPLFNAIRVVPQPSSLTDGPLSDNCL